MLDSPEGVCAGQLGFEYPATSVLFSMCSHPAPSLIAIQRVHYRMYISGAGPL